MTPTEGGRRGAPPGLELRVPEPATPNTSAIPGKRRLGGWEARHGVACPDDARPASGRFNAVESPLPNTR